MFVVVVVVEVKDLDSAAAADWAAKSIWMTRQQQQQEVRKDLIIFIANSKWTNNEELLYDYSKFGGLS